MTQVKATLRPVGATNSTPRALTVRPDPTDGPGVQEVLVTANVVGAWTLHLEVNGPQGPSSVDTPVAVAGPAAIPVWVGWLIGLTIVAALWDEQLYWTATPLVFPSFSLAAVACLAALAIPVLIPPVPVIDPGTSARDARTAELVATS